MLEVVPGEPLMQKPDAFGCDLGAYLTGAKAFSAEARGKPHLGRTR